MLYASLVLSLILLVAVNRIVARSSYPIPKAIFCCLALAVGPGFMMIIFPAVLWQALFLSVLLVILLVPNRGKRLHQMEGAGLEDKSLMLPVPNRGKRLYLPLSCIATLVAYVILIVPAVEKQQEFVQLRQQYPYESLEERLPPRPSREPSPVSNPKRLNQLEEEIAKESGWVYDSRAGQLKRIHETSVEGFVNSAGFGVGRVMRPSEPDAQTLKNDRDRSPPQPDYLTPFIKPTSVLSATVPDWDSLKIERMHDRGILDFVNPKGFGYVKDRGHVAGFQSHGMTKAPDSSDAWVVARIDLVGLLRQEKPVVYVSANLPRMDELRAVPTRRLDDFEAEALKSLQGGEDLFVRGTNDKALMLGAIRATKQCLDCHGGNRGDLLGAFSYGLRRQDGK